MSLPSLQLVMLSCWGAFRSLRTPVQLCSLVQDHEDLEIAKQEIENWKDDVASLQKRAEAAEAVLLSCAERHNIGTPESANRTG